MSKVINTDLIRGIRRWDLVAILINGVIGAGIFGLPSRIYALVGSYSLLAYIICALLILLIVFCFAEVGSRFQDTGGPYLYARKAFGSFIGFEMGWFVWLTRVTAFAALCNLLIDYLSFVWQPAVSWRILIASLIVLFLTIINVIGVRKSATVIDLFTIGKLLPLTLFIVIGFFFIDFEFYSFTEQISLDSLSTSVLLLVFAFSGFEAGVIPAGETQDPRRHIPFAMFTMIIVVVIYYILIQFVCVGTLPQLANSDKPLADAASNFLGSTGGIVISIGALISITGTLNSTMLTAPRALFAMAEQKQLPQIFAATHTRFHTPYIAIIFSAAIMLWLTLSGSFISALKISTLIRLFTYATTSLAVPILRRKKDFQPGTFQVPGGLLVSVLALGLIAWLLSNTTMAELRDLGITAVVGSAVYFIYKFKSKIT